MKSVMQLKKEMVVVWLVIAGILAGTTASVAHAQDTKVPGFDLPIQWGMSQQELEGVLTGLKPWVPKIKAERGGEYGDTQWMGASLKGQYDGHKCNLSFWMDESGLVAFSCTLGKLKTKDMMNIITTYGERFEKVKSVRADNESLHTAWKFGNTRLDMTEIKMIPGTYFLEGSPLK